MSPRTIHLVRHAQGYHNVSWQHNIRDPALTPLGLQQCATLSSSFPYHSRITRVLCSPLKRTIQTCLHSFGPAIENCKEKQGSDFIVQTEPLFLEVGDWECDIGSSLPELKDWLEEKNTPGVDLLDFTGVEREKWWPNKKHVKLYNSDGVEKRAEAAREWLGKTFGGDDAEDKGDVVLVTHGGFLHYLTDDWEGYNDVEGTAWKNTHWRSYVLEKKAGGDWGLRETEASRERRLGGVDGVSRNDSPDETEKREVEAGGRD